MLLNDLVNKTKNTESLFSKVYKKAENKPKFKRKLTCGMILARKLPNSDDVFRWLTNMNILTAQLKNNVDKMKEEFRAHRIASLTNASVGLIGAANCWNPVGWGLMSVSSISELTNVITEACISQKENVKKGFEDIKNEIENPFESESRDLANFIKGYKMLTKYIKKVVDDNEIPEILGVIFGCMYINECYKDPENIKKVWDGWRICHNKSDINKNMTPSFKAFCDDGSRLKHAFNTNNIAFSVGVPMLCLCKAGLDVTLKLMHNLSLMENISVPIGMIFALELLPVIGTILGGIIVGVTVTLSVTTLINDSIKIHNIDKTYAPYYNAIEEIKNALRDIGGISKEFEKFNASVKNYGLLCEYFKNYAINNNL